MIVDGIEIKYSFIRKNLDGYSSFWWMRDYGTRIDGDLFRYIDPLKLRVPYEKLVVEKKYCAMTYNGWIMDYTNGDFEERIGVNPVIMI